MKKLRIVFMGTPEFAVASLDAICKSSHEVIAVITATDKPAGRGKQLQESAVKKYAKEHDILTLQPEKLKAKNFLQTLNELNPDVIVVVAFRYLPKEVWKIPKLGTFNLHGSLLPDYRGAAPIHFAVINNEKTTGVTTFLIDETIDTGKILLQKELDILPTDTTGIVHDKLMEIGKELVIETLNGIANSSITPKIQSNDSLKLAYKIQKEDCKINWNRPCEKIYHFVRGLAPFPCAFSSIKIDDKIKQIKIYFGEYQLVEHQREIGSTKINNNKLEIYTLNGVFIPTLVQLEGKKMMSIKDFLNGISNKDNIEFV
jgi:methionyl-tRNA formyltransferase